MKKVMTALVTMAFLGCGGAVNVAREAPANGPAVTKQGQAVSGNPQDPTPPPRSSEPMPQEAIDEEPASPPAQNMFRLTKDRAEDHFYHPVNLQLPSVTPERACPACDCPFCT